MRLRSLVVPALAAALTLVWSGPARAADAMGDVVTPVGRNVVVSPLPGVVVTFDNVILEGITSAELTILPPGDRDTPCGNRIPDYAEPPGPDDHFEVYLIESTAMHTDSIEVQIEHPAFDTRLIRAACFPPEIFPFRGITTLAIPGDPRGRVPRFSEFVVIHDTRPVGDVVDAKLAALVAILTDDSPMILCLDDWMLVDLREIVLFIMGSLAEEDYGNAALGLHQLKNTVIEWSGTRIPNLPDGPCGNVAGEMTSEASTLLFTVAIASETPRDPGEVGADPGRGKGGSRSDSKERDKPLRDLGDSFGQ